jgi:hypothetical protein
MNRRGGFRRRWIPAGVAVALAVMAVVCSSASAAPAATASVAPHIVVFSPRAYQVVQRDAGGWADLTVTGRLVGIRGPVEVRWPPRRWFRAACSPAGRFRVTMPACWGGQAKIVARAARRHGVTVTVPYVGVGDVYVVAGQSNASGRGARLNRVAHRRLKAGLFGNDYRWGPLVDPTDAVKGQVDSISRDWDAGGSIWPLVATRLMGREAVPVAFIPCAAGATSLAEWERSGAEPLSRRTLFGSMIRRVRAAGGRVRAVLFWQGESDARRLTTRSEYASLLAQLAADVRAETGAPLVVAQIGDIPLGSWTVEGIDAIRMAQEDILLAPDPAGGIVPGPVLYDIDLKPGWHPETRAQSAVVADRWTAALRSWVLGADAARSPVIVRAVYDGATTVTMEFALAGGVLAPGAAGGFALRTPDGPVALTGAEVVPPDSVALRLAEPIPYTSQARITLSLGSGRDGAGAPVPVESSAWRLPAWPFVGVPVTTTP